MTTVCWIIVPATVPICVADHTRTAGAVICSGLIEQDLVDAIKWGSEGAVFA